MSGPLQIAVRGPTPNVSGVRLLHQPFALVGRDPRADVPLDHKHVSRRHLYLQVVVGQTFWIDLDSRSGTLSEGLLRKSGWLETGGAIRIGPFELERLSSSDSVKDSYDLSQGPTMSPLVARSDGDHVLPEVTLEFLNGPSRSACWPMNRMMSLIGSANGCKFRLADPSVSPFHCSLLRTPVGLWVIDLLGPEGIAVNDLPVRHALLADNDVLKVGRYRICVRIRFEGRGTAVMSTTDDQRSTIPASRNVRGNPLQASLSHAESPPISASNLVAAGRSNTGDWVAHAAIVTRTHHSNSMALNACQRAGRTREDRYR